MQFSELNKVNNEINQLPYRNDVEQYHKNDYWVSISQTGGDCEDFAIAKLNKLLDLGWPLHTLRLGTVFTETGSYHAVLIVESEKGFYILDNRQPRPVPISDLNIIGYKTDKIQKSGGSQQWVQWL